MLFDNIQHAIAPTILLVGVIATGHASANADADAVVPEQVWNDEERVRQVLTPTNDFSKPENFERMQGGAGSSKKKPDKNAYSQQTQTLALDGLQRFKLGNALFNKLWVSSPASTLASDGLGPFFNARACQSCHVKDGRGQRPLADEKMVSLLLQLKHKVNDQWLADPDYGSQLQTSAVPGIPAEAQVAISTTPVTIEFKDGTHHTLQRPKYKLSKLAFGDMHKNTVASPRIAPSMPGMGLLEAINPEHILAYADPDDNDGDGISGRPNWQRLPDGTMELGRFGHKAAVSSVSSQSAHAFFFDMGLSTPELKSANGDCTKTQVICASMANGVQPHLGDTEVSADILELVSFYSSNLAVPIRRNIDDKNVLAGKALFYESGCIACHTPKFVTSRSAPQKEHRFQLIWPYSDLLLHDMGEGLADNAGDGQAKGSEWRTAPLWGIGLAKEVNPRTSYLHDGRADTLLDAILWHGGEAEVAKNKIVDMNHEQRKNLITFLESL